MLKIRLFSNSLFNVRFSTSNLLYRNITIKIGNVTKILETPANPELVPTKYLPDNTNKTITKHLQWMLQKDNLGQDMFLIGPPGSYRRVLAMSFAELTKREIEYVSLSRDTTESDLKQRREIVKGNAIYIDQTALRAAAKGRILILDGIEKAERNVLPILNNLLENREMQLEDGRFLMRGNIYDKLLLKYTQKELDMWKFVRCNENFRVLALGLPSPKFKGNPLDPPLRSRFQARFVDGGSYEEMVNEIKLKYPKVNVERIGKIMSLIHAIRSEDISDLELPYFPLDNIINALGMMEKLPQIDDMKLIDWVYPYELISTESSMKVIHNIMNKFELKPKTSQVKFTIKDLNKDSIAIGALENSVWRLGNTSNQIVVPRRSRSKSKSSIILTSSIEEIMAELIISHSIGDFCIIGSQGCGKSMIVEALSNKLGARITHVVLYGDMTAREVLQQRETQLETGDTVWRNSALVRASMEGGWAVLEGLHRLERGCMSVLSQLVTDRQLQLFDGSRLLRHDRYDAIQKAENLSDEEMASKGIYRIHPDFRIIALADRPALPGESSKENSSNKTEWLTPEVLALFRFHVIPDLSRNDEKQIVSKLIPNISMDKLEKLLDITHKLRESDDPQIKDLSQNLSIRQIIRISHRLTEYPNETISNSIHKACLSKFLPNLVQDSLNQYLKEFESVKKPLTVSATSDAEQLEKLLEKYSKSSQFNGAASTNGEEEAKVPNILFYDSVAHTRIMLEMLQDFLIGTEYCDKQHLLLVGNQGVGKNKIVDRFLQLLNRSREYIQLHRDTTVQTLTLQPSIKDGRLIYEDSALVKAISKGRILVVDEADKASTQVTCILKTLISLGEMELSDGRRIIPENRDISDLAKEEREKIIKIHPDFRMIVLANRPGFPFLGNDFFGAMGDVFSCHAVDNPDMMSEIKMLQKYGPSVPIDTIKKLVFLFSDLRELADKGQINYPYSTREIVNIVKHLEKYPNDAISTVLGNVFDFDVSNKEMMSILESTLEKHGISLPGTEVKVILVKELPLPPPVNAGKWIVNTNSSSTLPVIFHDMSKQKPFVADVTKLKVDSQISRSRTFRELSECVSIGLGEYNIISDMLASNTDGITENSKAYIHLVTLNPIALTTLALSKDSDGNCNKLSSCSYATQVDLSELFPQVQGSFKPFVCLSTLSSPYENCVILFEACTKKLFQINTESGEIVQIICESCLPENQIKPRPVWFGATNEVKKNNQFIKMYRDWSNHATEPIIIFQKAGDDFFSILNLLDKSYHTVTVGFPIQALHMMYKDQWVVEDYKNRLYTIVRSNFNDPSYTLYDMGTDQKPFSAGNIFIEDVNKSSLHPILNSNVNSDTLGIGRSAESYAHIFPPLLLNNQPSVMTKIPRSSALSSACSHMSTNTLLASSGIIVNSIEKQYVPNKFRKSEGFNFTSTSGYLEVVNLKSMSLKYLQIPSVFEEPVSFSWLKSNIPDVFVTRLHNDVITIDNTGCLHKWTVCPVKLESELSAWKSSIGVGSDHDRDVMIERLEGDVNTNLGGPKHGKVDPTGAPHMGGNTWAGGSGGRDTAGLGGIGGPYRLDGGHDVYQVPDSVKASVPQHVKDAARAIAEKAWKERLNHIKMSELDYDLYMRYYKRVESQIVAIRAILDSLQASSKERLWIRHRTHGDLDDGKLVEGVLGEKSIYRARGEKEPEPGSPQTKPKRVRIICDLSGSMYRFNGHDKRLERQMEAILMFMESFVHVKSEKLIYDIYGHSGEGPQFPFVKLKQPPKNEKERMDVLSEMLAHSQFCLSGDHTLEAIDAGIKDLKKISDSVDQSFLVVLSDANLSRYGIPASSVSRLLMKDKEIHSFIVFIGSLGDQAVILKSALPVGRAFVCMDIETLPQILRHIFTTNLL